MVAEEKTQDSQGGPGPSATTHSSWKAYLDQALATEWGIAILCHSREKADDVRQALYAERLRLREAGDNSYDALSLSISPHAGDVLYVYRTERKEAAAANDD